MKPGTIGWIDLTVDDAETVGEFYAAVVGWRPEPVDMGEYSDFNMITEATGEPAAGVCHARGSNAALPPAWMIYIVVEDLDASVAKCRQLGGEIVVPVRGSAGSRYCAIQDPAGAVCTLFETASETDG